MVENLDSGTRAGRTLQATALLMMVGVAVIGARGREAAPPPAEMAGSTEAPTPAPAAFLAAPSRGGDPDGPDGPDGVSARYTSERIAALSKVLSGGDRAPAAAPSEEPGASVASAVTPGSNLAGRAEVVARLERGGAVYWVLSVRPEGRFLRAGVSSGPGSRPGAASPPEPYLRRIEGRFELVTGRGRYRVVEPPWEGSRTAIVGESP